MPGLSPLYYHLRSRLHPRYNGYRSGLLLARQMILGRALPPISNPPGMTDALLDVQRMISETNPMDALILIDDKLARMYAEEYGFRAQMEATRRTGTL